MQVTYIASDNTASNGTALDSAGKEVEVFKLIFGAPADGKYATVYTIDNPVTGATTNIAAKVTQPTAAAGKEYTKVVDFTVLQNGEVRGLRLGEGGNVVTDASQVTVLWDFVS
jgi:hypothetical protein